jgi:5-methylcytosine-specific restriction protein A
VLRRDNYLCQCSQCKAENRTTPATEVDHVVSKAKARTMGWTKRQIDDPSNLQAINTECHKRKTIEENGRTYRERARVGLDGWPLDRGGASRS